MNMTTFKDWYQSAVTKGGDWAGVAENAKRPARYEKPETQTQFQEAIAAANPSDQASFEATCLPFHLTGEPLVERF